MKLTRILLTLTILSLLAACQAGFMRSLKVPYAFSAYQKTALSYGDDPAQRLDVYRPTAAQYRGKTLPVVVFFFGGSWRSGKRAWYEFFAAHYALKGYVVVVPDYRKAPTYIFPSFVEDAAASVAYVRNNSAKLNVNQKRLYVMGHSAGAHVAALLLLDAQYLQAQRMAPTEIKGFIGLSGPYDFLPMTDPLVVEVFKGDANLPESQPINYAQFGAKAPPMLLIHGQDDRLVYPKNSVNLANKVNVAGGRAEVVVLAKTGHVKTLFQAGRGLRGLAPEVDTRVLEFLARE
jgi:acetyl esterase/lipase